MDSFLETHKFSKLTQDEMENLNRFRMSKEIIAHPKPLCTHTLGF